MHTTVTRLMTKVTILVWLVPAAYGQSDNAAPSSVSSSIGNIDIEQLATLEYPWGMALHRLIFGPDDKLYITSGERMRFEPAQNLSYNLGKIVRINTDGSVPDDNPFVDDDKARDDIWTYGHRNILSAAIDPESERFWAFEMGPLGGDEVNIIEAGKNYGWPKVSNGSDYGGQTITSHLATEKYQAPVRSWTPVISPSGALFYQGSAFPEWQGDVLIGGLSSQALVRLDLDEDRVAVEERIDMQRRIRDLIEMPDGALLLIVDDAEGSLLRLTPSDQ